MVFPSLNELSDKALSSFKRFPIALLWAIFGTFFVMCVIEYANGEPFDDFSPEILTLILGISWFIGLQFFIEQQKQVKKWIWLKLVLFILLIVFYVYLSKNFYYQDNPIFFLRFALYTIAGHLFILFSPFIKKWDANAYWNFLKDITVALLRSGFFSFILYLGLLLAFFAIDSLFNINIKGRTYGQLFVFCLGIVNTWIYLTDFPKDIRKNTKIYFQKPLEVLVKFILIPLVLLYLVILYSYSFKIILEWNLPKGWVSYLVIALSFLGFTIQVIINPVAGKIKSWTMNKFQPWFYILLLPMLVLLFVSIFRRTDDYGITENRYFVILLAFWILGATLYMLFTKKKRLIVLPISLFILTLLSSFGFWGAISVSKRSQLAQFEKTFKTVVNNDKKATHRQIQQLKSITEYFNERDAVQQLDAITQLNVTAIVNEEVEKTYNNRRYRWTNSVKLIDSLNFKVDIDSEGYVEDRQYYSIYKNNISPILNITGYNTFVEVRAYSTDKFVNYNQGLSYLLENENMLLTVIFNDEAKTTYCVNLKERVTALVKENKPEPEVTWNDLTVKVENDSVHLKYIINELQMYMVDDKLSINQMNGYLLIKENR